MITTVTRPLSTPGLDEPPADSITRRELLTAAAAASLLVAVGCGSDGSGTSAPGSTVAGPTIQHRYGSTKVPASPGRVLTVGLVDHDSVLALGIVPVGITADPYSDGQPFGVWPWAQDELGDGKPEVLPFPEMNFERIAGLRPDLILAIWAGLTQEEYDKLSLIAPTVAQSADYGDYQTPWDEMTKVIGRALGREAAADAAVARVGKTFADARAQHPEFAGKSAAYAGALSAGGYYAETEGSTRAGILAQLGFALTDIPGENFYAEVSQEQIELFDVDLLLWELGDMEKRTAIESDPLYRQLAVHQQGRDVFVTDPDLAGGLALISVLSLPYVVEQLVPKVAAAVDGDPATLVPA